MVAIKPSFIAETSFTYGIAPFNRTKQLIQKNPGIYEGNLIHRLQEEIGSLTPKGINQIFFQLILEGYDFKGSLIYPPNTLDPIYNEIKRFTLLNEDLDDTDFEIFMATLKLKDKSTLRNISRKVVSQNSDHSENEILYRIGILFKDNIIIACPSEKNMEFLDLNWNLIMGE